MADHFHNRLMAFGTDGTEGVGVVHVCQEVLLAQTCNKLLYFLMQMECWISLIVRIDLRNVQYL